MRDTTDEDDRLAQLDRRRAVGTLRPQAGGGAEDLDDFREDVTATGPRKVRWCGAPKKRTRAPEPTTWPGTAPQAMRPSWST